eukprot:scaffold94120_cov40-Prasinocladus_malaysianus.AAC.1
MAFRLGPIYECACLGLISDYCHQGLSDDESHSCLNYYDRLGGCQLGHVVGACVGAVDCILLIP